jgi:GNAT superfamily N-acetyltransferase
VTIRLARTPEDWRAIHALCCRTGDGGDSIERSRWPFFGELWIGPYRRLAPDWAYVADQDGTIVGYLTGCPDTSGFRRARALAVTLPLLVDVARRRYTWNADTRHFVRRTLRLERGPEEAVRAQGPRRLETDYPAHLHMNVEAAARRHGIGGALLARFVEDLRGRRVPGIHLYCGAPPRGFYLRHGFEELRALELRSGTWVHLLGRRLSQGEPTR